MSWCLEATYAVVCKLPLLARRTRPRPSARATIGYLVYNLRCCDLYGEIRHERYSLSTVFLVIYINIAYIDFKYIAKNLSSIHEV